jgi:hypothetical protein
VLPEGGILERERLTKAEEAKLLAEVEGTAEEVEAEVERPAEAAGSETEAGTEAGQPAEEVETEAEAAE